MMQPNPRWEGEVSTAWGIRAVVPAVLREAGRPRTCDRAIMSRFLVVRRVVRSVVLAGQVGYVVRLVLSRPERSYVVE